MPPTLIVDDRARLVKTFVELCEQAAASAVAAHGVVTMGLTGGRDAVAMLPALGEARVDWGRAEIFFGDERAVPPAHPESNYGQLKQAWLDRSGVPADRVHRMRGEAADLEAAAREYEAELIARLGPAPALDVVVLGMGPDGHVCSLFPGHPLVGERDRLVAAIVDAPKPPPRRLTLTMPVLERARLVIVLATGEDKRPALDAALQDPLSDLPIAHVFRSAPRVVALGVRHG